MYITGWTAAAALAGAIPAWLTATRAVAWWWMIAIGVVVVVDAALAGTTRGLDVSRDRIASVRLTQSTTATLVVRNPTRRRFRGAVRDGWEPSAGASQVRHRVALDPGATTRLTTSLTPTRRGDRHAVSVTLRSEGPFRLAGRQRTMTLPGTLRVLPEFASRRHLPGRLRRLREIDGRTAVRSGGAGNEFDSLREYVIGDDVRAIDWRASARRADVVTRTFRPERDRRILIAIDTGRLSAGRVAGAPRLDAGIEATLLLSALAARAGDRVHVTAFDRSERARASMASGPSSMPSLANALADLEPSLVEPDWRALVRLVSERLSQRALVVLLTTIDTTSIDGGLLDAVAALGLKHQVIVASVDNPDVRRDARRRDDADAVYAAGAAARALLEVDAVGVRLRELRAEVVIAEPGDLAPALADRYLALKAAGRL